MPRLFSGLVLPDTVRQQLAMLSSPLPGAKWIDPNNLHLTLRFAGDIDPRQAHDFADELSRINRPAFDLSLQGLGIFGGKVPTSLWVGVRANDVLHDLARLHERAARRVGLKPETRKFIGHVTLARFKHARPEQVARFLERNGAFSIPPFRVEDVVLFSARPHTGGGPYVVEDYFPLMHSAPITSDTARPV